MAELPSSNRRLETWKEVAAYLGKNERTVKRWEAERALPVHRLPGDSRSRIYAHPAELDAWMKGIGGAAAPAEAPPSPRRMVPTVGLAAMVVAGLVGFAALATWSQTPHAPAPRLIPPPPVEAQRDYVEATEAWALRTPASLNEAQVKFNAAIQRDPDYAEAYAGLAKTYLLLREFTALPDSEAYPQAKSAAEHALALNDALPDAHAALGFVAANWVWDSNRAEREYRRAIALDPRNSTVRHWFGTFLLDQARPAEGLRQLDAALALSPGSAAIQADRALTLDYLGQSPAAIAELQRLEAASPEFKSPHDYLARIFFENGRDKEFFDESSRAARLTDDLPRLAMVEAGQQAFAKGGHRAALLAIRDVQTRQLQYGDGLAYALAQTDAMLGDDADACRYLQLSRHRHEPVFTSAAASPGFARLRKTPGACDAIDEPLHA